MKTTHIICAIAALLLTAAAPAQAYNRRDNMSDKLDEWISHAEDLGYRVIETDIDTMRDSITLTFDLGPGAYHAYAESSDNIDDLDMTACDERGRELDSDTLTDNYPALEFTIYDRQEISFELTAYSYDGRSRSAGEYCFVLARESDYGGRDNRGRDRNRRGHRNNRDNRDRWGNDWNDWGNDWNNGRDDWNGNWGNSGDRSYIENRLDDLRNRADDDDLRPVMEEIGETSDSETYEINLPRGRYVAFAAGGSSIEDLDLSISDEGGRVIAEDTQLDADPAVWFDIDHTTQVEIQVSVWTFAPGSFSDYYCLLVCEGR